MNRNSGARGGPLIWSPICQETSVSRSINTTEKSTATLITINKNTTITTSHPSLSTINPSGPYTNGSTFKDHIADTKLRCTPKLRAIKAITGQNFGQSK